jgi:predicted phosphodiesterase
VATASQCASRPLARRQREQGFIADLADYGVVKILCVSDTVMPQLESAVNLRRRYSDVQLVVSCGDLPAVYLEYIVSTLNVPLFYVRGNHDERYSESPPGGENLHMRVITHRGLTFAGLEGCMRYNDGEIQYTESQMARMVIQMGLSPAVWRGLDVLVTHSPPQGIHDRKDRAHTGFRSLRWFMQWYRPRYLVHGHTHTWDRRDTVQTQYRDTCVMNINPITLLEIEPRAD